MGLPPLFACILTIPLIIVPFMLGWLALEARRVTGSWSPRSVRLGILVHVTLNTLSAVALIIAVLGTRTGYS